MVNNYLFKQFFYFFILIYSACSFSNGPAEPILDKYRQDANKAETTYDYCDEIQHTCEIDIRNNFNTSGVNKEHRHYGEKMCRNIGDDCRNKNPKGKVISKKEKKKIANSKNHKELEPRKYGTKTCKRMKSNWANHAKAWCSDSGGVNWSRTNNECKKVGSSPEFTEVIGKITCNS